TGSESFPGEMLGSASENVVMSNSMLDLLVEYYLVTYETLEFRKPFGEGHENSRIISVKIKQFGRCRIGSETFGSNMSARHTGLFGNKEKKMKNFFFVRTQNSKQFWVEFQRSKASGRVPGCNFKVNENLHENLANLQNFQKSIKK
ncbi:hypothetical protein RhiirA5_382993, partial [Rhizophagus irregularis]